MDTTLDYIQTPAEAEAEAYAGIPQMTLDEFAAAVDEMLSREEARHAR